MDDFNAEDATLSNAQHQPDEFEGNSLASRACSELNVFVEYISSPTIDGLELDKSWMPQDLVHSRLFQNQIQINEHKSTRTTSLLADINDKAQRRAAAGSAAHAPLASFSPHLSSRTTRRRRRPMTSGCCAP